MKDKDYIQDHRQRDCGCPESRQTYKRDAKTINLALQGGGAHGAYAWGVIDRLLEDGRIKIEGISGTSAGSMNAVVTAYGNYTGGRGGARAALYNFWKQVSVTGALYSPIKRTPWELFQSHWNGDWNMDQSVVYQMFDIVTRIWSPYQFNPLNVSRSGTTW